MMSIQAIVLLLCGLAASDVLAADVTRQEAEELVKKIVIPATLEGDVTIYLSAAPLQPADVVRPFEAEDGSKAIQVPTWFAYIDDEPYAFFTHPTRFVYIDVANGSVTVEAQEWWPLVNNVPLFAQNVVDADPTLLIYSTQNFSLGPEAVTP